MPWQVPIGRSPERTGSRPEPAAWLASLSVDYLDLVHYVRMVPDESATTTADLVLRAHRLARRGYPVEALWMLPRESGTAQEKLAVLIVRADALFRAGYYQEASEAWFELCEAFAFPGMPASLLLRARGELGTALHRSGQVKRARRVYEAALAGGPDGDPEALVVRHNLAVLQAESGRSEAASRELERLAGEILDAQGESAGWETARANAAAAAAASRGRLRLPLWRPDWLDGV